MSFEVAIAELQPQSVAVYRFTSTPDKVGEHMAEALGAVGSYLGKLGVRPVGPPFSSTNIENPEAWVTTTGFPVSEPVPGEGPVEPDELPGGKAATTWHIGPYDTLGETYGALEAWIKAQGHECAGMAWEVYFTDPSQETDPSKWRTQIFWPIK